MEGLARALRIFLGMEKSPVYNLVTPSEEAIQVLTVAKETAKIRPFCVAAILRDIKFTEASYTSFIELQEKLHQNICRERTLVAIGTHDFNTISGPFSYEALPPNEIEFIPLKESRKFKAGDLLNYYENEKEQSPLKKYVPIIKNSDVYPVIFDKNRVVLSLPPIINGEHSKITVNTTDVFIECTATDLTKAGIVLNTIVSLFSQYSAKPMSVEAVRVHYDDGRLPDQITPDLSRKLFQTDIDYLNNGIGINITIERTCELLKKMQLDPVANKDGKTLTVSVPPTRPDILHPCDILEDVAIAYGYNNIAKSFPSCSTFGRQQPVNKFSDLIRGGVAEAGFTEVLTWALISRHDNFEKLRLKNDVVQPVEVVPMTAKTSEFEIVRTSLIPCLLKTLGCNRGKMPLPIQLFEVSDVCHLDSSIDVGSKNERRLAAIYCGKTSGFEIVHGLLDRVMQLNAVCFEESTIGNTAKQVPCYKLEQMDSDYTYAPCFIAELSAKIVLSGQNIGHVGVVHPEILSNFEIDAPCSILELNLESFL